VEFEMINYTHREPSKYELWVIAYEEFVEELKEGYDMSIYEYTNDMSIRQFLEDNRKELKEQVFWQRIELADIRLKEILKPTKCCIHGIYPIEYFWYWGYPPNSPELESDLKNIGAL